MTDYVLLLPGNEATWAAATEDDRRATYAGHAAFAAALAERGHTMTGGSELTHSREATVLRTAEDGTFTITSGPYAETVEQLTGFYVVETDDLADLIEASKILGEGVVEIRATVDHSVGAS